MNKLKPSIRKRQGFWVLRYRYPARAFALFGLVGAERERAREAHVNSQLYACWEDALSALRRLYRDRQIA